MLCLSNYGDKCCKLYVWAVVVQPLHCPFKGAATKSACGGYWLALRFSRWSVPNRVNLRLSGEPTGSSTSGFHTAEWCQPPSSAGPPGYGTPGAGPSGSGPLVSVRSGGMSPVFRSGRGRRRKSIEMDCRVCARIPFLGIQLAGLLSGQFRQPPRSKLGLREHNRADYSRHKRRLNRR